MASCCCWKKFTSLLFFILATYQCNAINATSVEDSFKKRLVAQDVLLNSSSNLSKRQNPHNAPVDFTNSFHQRIVAAGNFDGDLSDAMRALRLSHVVDDNGHWSGTADVFVQLGGVVNKGQDIIQLIRYLELLRKQAGPERVFTLMGEPELRNLMGDWGEVSKEDVDSFGSWQKRYNQIRGWIGDIWADNYLAVLRLPLHPSIGPPNTPPMSTPGSGSHPFSNAALLFVHGGIHPRFHMQYPFPTAINRVLKELIQKLQKIPLEIPSSFKRKVPFKEKLVRFESDLLDPNGPLSYRGWASNELNCATVDDVLKQTGTRRVIVSHMAFTKIWKRCNGKLILIDTGKVLEFDTQLGTSHWVGGHPSALIIEYTVTPVFEQGELVKLIEKEVIDAAYMNGKEKLVFQVDTTLVKKI